MGVALIVALQALLSLGCTTVGYLWQAAGGQCTIATTGRPLDEVIADPETPEELRELLEEVGSMKRFAVASGLEPTPNYSEYVELGRPHVVVVTSAAEPLRFEGKRWWFPIVGTVPYLGWFDKADALYYARELEEEGWDVDVRGAAAYSTLGWFEDPILSSMLSPGDPAGVGDLANTVLHESVHATYYVPSQSSFNESLASFVGDQLTLEYLEDRFGPGSPELRSYLEGEARAVVRTERLHRAFLDLERLYASDLSDAEKLAAKARYLAALRVEIDFARPINNATLMNFKTYHAGDEPFEELFSACEQRWAPFWVAVRSIDGASFREPQQEDLAPVLAKASARHCRAAPAARPAGS